MRTGSTISASSVVDPAEWIERNAREHPHRLFLRTPTGRGLSYQTLSNGSARLACALTRRGVTTGDRVAARVEKSVEAVLLYIACLRMGAWYVPINVGASLQELDYLLRDSSPRITIVPPGEADALEPIADRAGVQLLETLGADGEGSLSRLARVSEPEDPSPGAHQPHSVAALVYTSGTTGRSKGAMLTRANLASNATVLAEAWRFSGEDVLLHVLPLFHVHGLLTAINTVLASASSILLLPGIGIRVTNPESGAVERKPDVIGTLEVSGPNVFAGYWRDPGKTAGEFTADGWFKTGDLGRIDRDGYVHIVGRAKDLVISGGCNVYPREVELELDA